jgi:hypothetical protein
MADHFIDLKWSSKGVVQFVKRTVRFPYLFDYIDYIPWTEVWFLPFLIGLLGLILLSCRYIFPGIIDSSIDPLSLLLYFFPIEFLSWHFELCYQ